MKNLSFLILLVALSTACGTDNTSNTIVDDLIEAEQLEDEEEKQENGEHEGGIAIGDMVEVDTSEPEKDFSALESIETDVDVSVLPTTLAFAQVTRMMFDMETYQGNTVKIQGMYYHDEIPDLGIDRRTIMLLDETSCCQGYFEIQLPEDVEYPENGEQIMVIGEYVVVSDGEYSFPVLKVTEYIF